MQSVYKYVHVILTKASNVFTIYGHLLILASIKLSLEAYSALNSNEERVLDDISVCSLRKEPDRGAAWTCGHWISWLPACWLYLGDKGAETLRHNVYSSLEWSCQGGSA